MGCDSHTRRPADVTADIADTSPSDIAETDIADTHTPDTTAGCSDSTPELCIYQSLELAFDVRTGVSTFEPITQRTLPLVARVPRIAGPLPVVVWSHGGAFYAGGEDKSVEWGVAFARQGYVVIHVGHAAINGPQIRTLCDLALVPEDECVPSDDEDTNGLLAIGRSYDLKAVLDDLPRLSQFSVDNDGPELDLTRVVVAGWSGGSRGPMMLMGARVKPTTSAPVFTNPHTMPIAGLFMSPAGPGFGGWFENGADHSWTQLRGPTFSATGTHDQKSDKPDLSGEVRRRHFDLIAADEQRWLLFSNLPVGVGGHGTYDLADWQSNESRLQRLSQSLVSSALAFLDARVKGDAAAQSWLDSDHARVLAGDAEWLQR